MHSHSKKLLLQGASSQTVQLVQQDGATLPVQRITGIGFQKIIGMTISPITHT